MSAVPSGKRVLTAHFEAQGLDLSIGIRQALSRYMADEGLQWNLAEVGFDVPDPASRNGNAVN
jgi:hypothetical protein